MAEFWLLETKGGPHPGTRTVPIDTEVWSWPLPDMLSDEGGHYTKVNESQLPDDSSPFVARGASYEWVPEEISK